MELGKVTVNFKSGKSKTYRLSISDIKDISKTIKEMPEFLTFLIIEDDVIRFETVEFIEFFAL